jgi:L-alanine-DL-glutamate epimerase and related enzymes of enolase superfamily
MKFTRREWLQTMSLAAIGSMLPRSLMATATATNFVEQPLIRDFEKDMFNIPSQISSPVIIESIELLQVNSNYFVRVRSKDGAEGLVATKQMVDYVSIFKNLVAPYFIGQDARNIESLVDMVYRANYKIAGQTFWCPVAYIEQSILDMLGKVAGKSVAQLCGGIIRNEMDIYLSGSGRDTTAEAEVDVYVKSAALTNATAVKFKIGGRMSRNLDTYPGRTETLIKLGRKELGDKMILMADANGSYDVNEGIRVGKMLEDLNYYFYEEPCPWQNYSETRAVAKALKIPIACGEQDSNIWQFWWMMEHSVMKIVQPDINYNGGFIRAKRVAKMAEEFGMNIIPHNTQTGVTSVNILQFAACTPNAQPLMEYPCRKPQTKDDWYSPNFIIQNGKIQIPTTPGMGVNIDNKRIEQANLIAKIVTPKVITG